MKQSLASWFILLLFLLYSCTKEYSYEGGPLSAGYLVKDSLGNCSFIKQEGIYKTGIQLGDSNFLEVSVHVGKTGSYRIFSNQINGYVFEASGNFSDTGFVQVRLKGSGKPITPQQDHFKIQYDSSACEVAVHVMDTALVAVAVTNPDHFPLTPGSFWVYDDLTFPGDSVIRTITGSTMLSTMPYTIINEYKSFYPANNKQYYTKLADNYFRYASASGFTSALNYSPSIYDDFNFLKEGLRSGASWYSNTYSGRTSLGVEVKQLRYYFQCIDANASLLLNGRLFKDVYEIEMTPEWGDPGFTPQPTGEVHILYYAKGVGLIYSEFFNGVLPHPVLKIRRWLVN